MPIPSYLVKTQAELNQAHIESLKDDIKTYRQCIREVERQLDSLYKLQREWDELNEENRLNLERLKVRAYAMPGSRNAVDSIGD